MKKIAVVGANSFIARNLIYVMKERYKDCHLFLYDYEDEHKDGMSNYRQINILDEQSISHIDMCCDIIYMFVGKTGSADGFDGYSNFIDINEKALLGLLNEYRRQGSKAKIVFPSSRLVYKGQCGKLTEEAEKEFKTIYAINKYACEKYLEMYHNVYDLQYCIFRICVPYGTLVYNASSYGTAEFMLRKAMNGDNIALYGNGSVRRTITHIEDLCNILIEGALCEKCKNDVYNIGGEDYSLKEMAELIADKYDVEIDYVEYPSVAAKIESGDTVFCDDKIRKICKIKFKNNFKQWCEQIK